MCKIIAIGDTHGKDYWKLIKNEQCDKFIFMGDYFDAFDIDGKEQIENFREIVEWKEAEPEKVVLLFGNHDFHYLPVARMNHERYSGFNEWQQHTIGHLLQQHMDILQMCYKHEDIYFTHAGITKIWLNGTKYENVMPVELWLNELFKHKPIHFMFRGRDIYGNDPINSPIWVRPESLMEDAIEGRFVCGHTRMGQINPKGIDGRFFFIDTLDSSKEYLVIEDGVISASKLVSVTEVNQSLTHSPSSD